MYACPALAQNFQKIAHSGARRACDERNSPRKRWQFSLALGAKQSFCCQLRIQLLKFELERTQAFQVQFIDDQVVLSAWGVDVEMTANDHFHPGVQVSSNPLGSALPDDRPDARAIILERQIAMSRRAVPAEIGNLPRDPYRRERFHQQFFENVRELRDRQDG